MPPPTPLAVIKMKAMNFKQILKDTPQSEKKGNVSTTLAQEFNMLIDVFAQARPDAADHLPPKLCRNDCLAEMPTVDAKYVDLEILVNNLIGLITLYEK